MNLTCRTFIGRNSETLIDFNNRKMQLASLDRSNNFVATDVATKHFASKITVSEPFPGKKRMT